MKSDGLIIIGGGPAGLMAAASGARYCEDIVLLEKMPQLAMKLKISGKGRCNLTNNASKNDMLTMYSDKGRFLKHALYNFSNTDLMKYFEGIGVKLKTERGSRVFPVSDRASDIVEALVSEIKKKKVKIKKSAAVAGLELQKGKVTGIKLTDSSYCRCRSVVLATGGLSYPKTGSAGDGYRILRDAGHKVTDIYPSLVPLEIEGNVAAEMQGLSLRNISASICCGNKKLVSRKGELMFTHFGLGGPVIIDMSYYAARLLREGKKPEVSLDMKTSLPPEKLDQRLQRDFDKYGRRKIKRVLKELLPVSMINFCLDQLCIDPEKYANQVDSAERKKLCAWLKDIRFVVSATRPIEEAIVTSGGIAREEIDRKTMRSKLIENLFIAGELIDVDGPTGGYNLQAAFSTGWLAGEYAAKTGYAG